MCEKYILEDILRKIWVNTIEIPPMYTKFEITKQQLLEILSNQELECLQELINKGFLQYNDQTQRYKLTNDGFSAAKGVIRRHRLAEVLLSTVFELPLIKLNQHACSLEHCLKKELEDKVCTMLGHPRFCPHNKPIPFGECCINQTLYTTDIKRLSQCEEGSVCKIIYIKTNNLVYINKLANLGIIPSSNVKLIKKFPAYVIKTQDHVISIDHKIAKYIFVKQTN